MSSYRASLLQSLCCVALLAACESEGGSGDSEDAGAMNTDAGADSDAGGCPSGAPGSLTVTIDLPSGVDANVTLTDEDAERTLTGSEEIELAAGEHTLTARRVTTAGDLVGRAYYPATVETTVCVRAGESSEVTIAYELEPGSERLWVLGGDDYHTASYAAADLNATGTPAPASNLKGSTTSPTSLAFDGKGNLWIADATGKVLGYARDSLGASRMNAPDVVLEGPSFCAEVIPCGPRALAFDGAGDLWLAMPKRVVRIAASELAVSGEPEVASSITGPSVEDAQSLAFDKNGALWVGEWKENSIVRFDAARLSADDSAAPDATLVGKSPSPVISILSGPSSLAFDKDGNLWVGYFGPNVIARYTPADQGAMGEVTPSVQLKVGVLALIEGMAFDEAGNLWLTGKRGQVARLAAAALTSSDSDLNAGAVLVEVQGYAQDVAFNPSASGTPLVR